MILDAKDENPHQRLRIEFEEVYSYSLLKNKVLFSPCLYQRYHVAYVPSSTLRKCHIPEYVMFSGRVFQERIEFQYNPFPYFPCHLMSPPEHSSHLSHMAYGARLPSPNCCGISPVWKLSSWCTWYNSEDGAKLLFGCNSNDYTKCVCSAVQCVPYSTHIHVGRYL